MELRFRLHVNMSVYTKDSACEGVAVCVGGLGGTRYVYINNVNNRRKSMSYPADMYPL